MGGGGTSGDIPIPQLLNAIYPVGTIYETEDKDFDPNESFGGTWIRIKGKVIVGVDENDNDFKVSDISGGYKDVTLSVDQMPTHEHPMKDGSNSMLWNNIDGLVTNPKGHWSVYHNTGVMVKGTAPTNNISVLQGKWNYTDKSGLSKPHPNMPPYYTAYIWKKTSNSPDGSLDISGNETKSWQFYGEVVNSAKLDITSLIELNPSEISLLIMYGTGIESDNATLYGHDSQIIIPEDGVFSTKQFMGGYYYSPDFWGNYRLVFRSNTNGHEVYFQPSWCNAHYTGSTINGCTDRYRCKIFYR